MPQMAATDLSKKRMVAAAVIEKRRRKSLEKTVVGIVHPIDGFTHAITNDGSGWVETDREPTVYLATKLEAVLRSTKRFIVVIGGRGSSKSVGVADICLIDAKDNGAKTYCLREFQSSIKNSVHSLLKEEIGRLEMAGFDAQQQSILRGENDVFQFAGISRNVDNIKSAHGFKRFYIEEAQFLTQDSLDVLTPTARNKPNKGLPKTDDEVEAEKDNFSGVSMVFVANVQSSEDPFSKRFVVPFQAELDRNGIYEDELHLIVVINHDDNPWFRESGLDTERIWAKETISTAMYDHIWEGAYNDSVDNALIMAEWFDACVDAHIKLGFEPRGAIIGSHDASDRGGDSKTYAMRHGNVLLDLQEKLDGDVNQGGHWAADLAISQRVESFSWDGDGMGAALNEQMSKDFKDKPTAIYMFKGSETPDNPEAIYKPAQEAPIANQKPNKDVFRNKRAQYYVALRDRCYKTYRAVVHGDYIDPDELISFSSKIELLGKLRAELCRMPIKPHSGGLITLYTKEEMRNKFGFPSPNCGDVVMMLQRYVPVHKKQVKIPAPIGSISLGSSRRGRR